jgi:hypothetical protein
MKPDQVYPKTNENSPNLRDLETSKVLETLEVFLPRIDRYMVRSSTKYSDLINRIPEKHNP